jgi:hypothetical protein
MSKELSIQDNFTPAGLQLELSDFINKSKDQIKDTATKAYNSVMDGDYDAIDALIFIKKGSELFKELDAKIRPIAEGKSVGPDYQKFGVKITEGMTGIKYSFDECNDPIYNDLNISFEIAKEMLEERKTFLKSVTKKMTIVDEASGDIVEINPPIKSGKLGLTLTIK